MAEFKLVKGSMQHRAMMSRAKVRLIGGGFGNGKTATACAIALELAKAYPGSNGLIARSTYPKLNDTIRKEFIKWCPTNWVKSFPKSQNSTNTCTLKNGTTINFRYIAQQGKQNDDGSTTSNLLSATYDWIIVDQLEDPEIVEKDFDDLLGRLRGNTPYAGEDESMPQTGPRWFIGMTNPTRNWVYTSVVRPYKEYMEKGKITDKLLCLRDSEGKPIPGDDGKPQLLMELFEAATYENKHNLGEDFIQMLESKYRGSQKERFLQGLWAAYEGLVYPEFDDVLSSVSDVELDDYLMRLYGMGLGVEWWETYDFGISVPSCYILGFADPFGNQFAVGGFYEAEKSIFDQWTEIRKTRARWGAHIKKPIAADPDIFRRKVGDKKQVGKSVVQIFQDCDPNIMFSRANNNIEAGILKVQEYTGYHPTHRHPLTGQIGAPYFYYNSDMTWLEDEFGGYYWAKRTDGTSKDVPQDKNDHAMDAIRYRLVACEDVALIPPVTLKMSAMHNWTEMPDPAGPQMNRHRYG